MFSTESQGESPPYCQILHSKPFIAYSTLNDLFNANHRERERYLISLTVYPELVLHILLKFPLVPLMMGYTSHLGQNLIEPIR